MKKGKRPDSFVSDTSSDYDSLSNLDQSRRPQSFVLDDEYEVIAEEETGEIAERRPATTTSALDTAAASDKSKAATVGYDDDDNDDASSESSEDGPGVQAVPKTSQLGA